MFSRSAKAAAVLIPVTEDGQPSSITGFKELTTAVPKVICDRAMKKLRLPLNEKTLPHPDDVLEVLASMLQISLMLSYWNPRIRYLLPSGPADHRHYM